MLPANTCIQYTRAGDQWSCRLVQKENNKVVSVLAEGWGRRKEVAKRNMKKFA